MDWNYIGIDDDPPPGPILGLTALGKLVVSTRADSNLVAWAPHPKVDVVKARCQYILRGQPELKMVHAICKELQLFTELKTAIDHYHDDQLADFTDLIRTLNRQATRIHP